MLKNLAFAGSLAGIAGALTCLVAGLTRAAGIFYIVGFQSTTLFNVGVGLMVFACMVKLDVLADGSKGN